MSDNMEREKNERLTARQIEEEEMKRELTGIGIYEPGITYGEMKKLLGFLNGSQDTSNVASNNKDTQKETQYSDNEHLEITSDMNVSQETASQKCSEIPTPSYSYKLNRISSMAHKTVHYTSSPESPTSFEVRNSVYRHKSSDSDEIFEKQYESTNSIHSTNRFLSLRSGNIPRECQNAIERRTVQDEQGELMQKLEKWQLNPLDICINENDVPLQQPNRSLAQERIPFKCCKEAYISEQRDQIIRSMSQHLKEMADFWYTWHSSTNMIFQWGSPIQVGVANGSLDKKPLSDPKIEQVKAECTYRDSHERSSKRKASALIASLSKESSTEDEDDNQYNFAVKRKRAKSDGISDGNIDRAVNEDNVDNSHEKTTLSVIVNQRQSFNDDNSDTDFDNEHIKFLHPKKKTDNEDERVSPELTIHSRKIIPSNSKARLSLSRQKKGNVTSKPSPKMQRTDKNKVIEQAKKQKKSNTMTAEEISQELEKDWNSDEEEAVVKKDVEIRPLPIPREVRARLQEKRLLSNKTETVRETRATVKKEENDGEQNKRKRQKLCGKRKKEELCRIENKNGSWEHQLLSDDEDLSEVNRESDVKNDNRSDSISTSANNISCPICNKSFPHNEIEDHAADCEQFETNNEENDNNADQLECNICSNYKTNNGVEYEEHVQQCIINRHDKKHSSGFKDIDTTSTSFRTYKPISEQKDSEIDYLGQFSPKSTAKICTDKKRKR